MKPWKSSEKQDFSINFLGINLKCFCLACPLVVRFFVVKAEGFSMKTHVERSMLLQI